MRPPLAAIVFMTYFYRAGGGHESLGPPGPIKISHKNNGRQRIDFMFLGPYPAAGFATVF